MKNLEFQCMMHRYLYYVLSQPVISDYEYDMLERRALAGAAPDSPLNFPGSDQRSSYSPEVIRAAEKRLDRQGEDR